MIINNIRKGLLKLKAILEALWGSKSLNPKD